jgi:CheY-like chemotaxis protein
MNKMEHEVGLYVVIADDDFEDHSLIRNAIANCNVNHIVTSVYNGAQLMNLLLKEGFYKAATPVDPDLVILDLKMPILDGFGVLEQIKKYPELQKIPVFTLSDTLFNDDKERAIALGALQHYSKPYDAKELSRLIQSICTYVTKNKSRKENSPQ